MIAYQPHRFTREEYYALAPSLNPDLKWELLDGSIYAVTNANPPHAGIVKYLEHRFQELDRTKYQIVVQDALEIDNDGSSAPDVSIVKFRDDFYTTRHPNGADAYLVIEVGDTERNPLEKMRAYMRDGRIQTAWRIDIRPRYRQVEIWEFPDAEKPASILTSDETFGFANVVFIPREIFALLDRKTPE